jgi:hypothetical protein
MVGSLEQHRQKCSSEIQILSKTRSHAYRKVEVQHYDRTAKNNRDDYYSITSLGRYMN